MHGALRLLDGARRDRPLRGPHWVRCPTDTAWDKRSGQEAHDSSFRLKLRAAVQARRYAGMRDSR
jgi:hypothetical protein